MVRYQEVRHELRGKKKSRKRNRRWKLAQGRNNSAENIVRKKRV
jgi:hypothetical protein